jgi:hypothetical protein
MKGKRADGGDTCCREAPAIAVEPGQLPETTTKVAMQ